MTLPFDLDPAALSGGSRAPTIDLRDFATVIAEKRGSSWVEPSDDVVIGGLLTTLESSDTTVSSRAERTLREMEPGRLATWLREQLDTAGEQKLARISSVIVRLELVDLVPDLVRVALRTSTSDLSVIGNALKAFPHFREMVDWIQAPDDPVAERKRDQAAAKRATSTATRLRAAKPDDKIGLMRRLPADIEEGPLTKALQEIAIGEDPDEVRLQAIATLRRADLGVRLGAAEAILKRSSVELRVAALDLLRGGSTEEMSLLVKTLHDKSPKVGKEAIAILGAGPAPGALAILWGALLGVSRDRQSLILELLQRFDTRAVALLARQILESEAARERLLGIWVLGTIDPRGSHALLLDALTDPEDDVRMEAVNGLATVDDPEAISAVGGRVKDPDPGVHAKAVEVLSGYNAEFSARYLVDACKDPADEVRDAAEAALMSAPPRPVADELVTSLATPSHRRIARNLLTRIGDPALPSILAALPTVEPEVAGTIGELLQEMGAEETLVRHLEDQEVANRLASLDGLRAMNAWDAIDDIALRLGDPVAFVRIRAAETLAGLGDKKGIEPLKTAFVSDPDMDVVAAIEIALRSLTGETGD